MKRCICAALALVFLLTLLRVREDGNRKRQRSWRNVLCGEYF